MSRVAMVTRTITTTECNVLCMNVALAEPCNEHVVLSGSYTDPEKMLKAVKKQIETDTLKPVQVVHFEEKETLYGMTEQEFIQKAQVLPPRGTKATE